MYLFKPFKVKDMEQRNRVVMPPMCMYSADTDGIATDFHFTHYTSRAVGGVGLIIMEATGVVPWGRISDHCLGLWNDAQAQAIAPIVTACRKQGAKIAIQLNHAGRKCEAQEKTIYAPSAIPFDKDSPMPREMTEEDIHDVVNAFQSAAKRAADVGFDAIEIHGAHGYLISEFLSPLTNRRTDGYGGSTENRCRILIEVLQAVRRVWPEEKPILLRVSAEDYEPEGMHPQEMAKIIELVKPYIDVLDVSTGGVVPTPPTAIYPGYQVKVAEELKGSTGIPTITVGLIMEPHQVEEILGQESADLVALGRELLRDPYWVLHTAREMDVEYLWPEQYVRGFDARK
ncbi:NADPH dehydrogenase NamA [Clostridium sp. C105KSO13]|uniref:NADPH dehydrogenase NamA n=1 Tax=Clostridium sp. C105KSO13 TaxID=1776045 RepID=UPI0007406E80|nr:NADPH dehydrogenase NamA [Clostridium sp. C105KSO13]CUX18278.1 NADPH dehydrogenase [Clostridium sp. C105KSO13]